jgi:hypothetical protein
VKKKSSQDQGEQVMKKIILSLCPLLLFVTLAHAGQEDYPSPDGKFRAVIIGLRMGESRVIVITKKGRTVCSKSYGSEDGEHGYAAVKAEWTPNSIFFVYSLASSGGHQPWRSPTYFVSTQDSRIRSLDDYVGAVTEPEFELSPPDRLRAVGTRDYAVDEGTPFEVSLSELVAREKRK